MRHGCAVGFFKMTEMLFGGRQAVPIPIIGVDRQPMQEGVVRSIVSSGQVVDARGSRHRPLLPLLMCSRAAVRSVTIDGNPIEAASQTVRPKDFVADRGEHQSPSAGQSCVDVAGRKPPRYLRVRIGRQDRCPLLAIADEHGRNFACLAAFANTMPPFSLDSRPTNTYSRFLVHLGDTWRLFNLDRVRHKVLLKSLEDGAPEYGG